MTKQKTNFICVQSGYEHKVEINQFYNKLEPWGNVNDKK
jgi:hypothetical protein